MIYLPNSFKLIMTCVAGSNLYGTNTPLSDIDERGVFIPDEKYFLGFLNKTEQFEDKVNDITYFELRKFLYLALDSNPNILELLFIPDNKYLIQLQEWKTIVNNRDLFLSKKCKFTFTGYAHSQFNRIKLHRRWLLDPPTRKPEREDYGLDPSRALITTDNIGAFNVLLALKLENIKELHPLKEQLDIMTETHDFKGLCKQYPKIEPKAIKAILEISDNFIDALERENHYNYDLREYNQYENWKKNRNPERAILEAKFGYDTKHASHLCRLISEGEELLMTGFITFPRPDVKFLLDIKNGLYKYEEISNLLESYDAKFNELYEKSPLRNKPERVKVDELCQVIVKDFLGFKK